MLPPGWPKNESTRIFPSLWLFTGAGVLMRTSVVIVKVFIKLASMRYGYGAPEQGNVVEEVVKMWEETGVGRRVDVMWRGGG